MIGLIRRFLSIGADETKSEFDAQRIRTLNAGVLMIIAVAVVSLPVMVLSERGQTVPGTGLFLVLVSLVVWLQASGRAYAAALSITGIGLFAVGAQSYYLGRDFGVHFWLLALILFPFLFFSAEQQTQPHGYWPRGHDSLHRIRGS